MSVITVAAPKLYVLDGRHFILAPRGLGEELAVHLAAHGIRSQLSAPSWVPHDRLDLEGRPDSEIVQAILDHWES